MGDGHDPLPPSGEPEEPPVTWDRTASSPTGTMNESMFIERLGRFVGEYWNLSPGDRHAEWKVLNEQTESFPEYQSRLRELKAGLDVIWPEDIEDRLQPVVRCVEKLYVLPRYLRTSRLPGICQKEGLQVSKFKEMGDTLLEVRPKAKDLLDVLGFTWSEHSKTIAAEYQNREKQRKELEAAGRFVLRNEYRWLILVVLLMIAIVGFIMFDRHLQQQRRSSEGRSAIKVPTPKRDIWEEKVVYPPVRDTETILKEWEGKSEADKVILKTLLARRKVTMQGPDGKKSPDVSQIDPKTDNPKKESE